MVKSIAESFWQTDWLRRTLAWVLALGLLSPVVCWVMAAVLTPFREKSARLEATLLWLCAASMYLAGMLLWSILLFAGIVYGSQVLGNFVGSLKTITAMSDFWRGFPMLARDLFSIAGILLLLGFLLMWPVSRMVDKIHSDKLDGVLRNTVLYVLLFFALTLALAILSSLCVAPSMLLFCAFWTGLAAAAKWQEITKEIQKCAASSGKYREESEECIRRLRKHAIVYGAITVVFIVHAAILLRFFPESEALFFGGE